jgi:hypothetical protein
VNSSSSNFDPTAASFVPDIVAPIAFKVQPVQRIELVHNSNYYACVGPSATCMGVWASSSGALGLSLDEKIVSMHNIIVGNVN